MKVSRVTVVPIQIAVGRISLKIKEPGIVRGVAFEQKPNLILRAGEPQFIESPVIFVEASPDGPLVNRSFVAIQSGELVEVADDERAIWMATGVSARGMVVHVFEVAPR